MNIVLAIGLMSGSAGEGIDAALIETDSYEHIRPLAFQFYPYSDAVRELIGQACEAATRHSIVEADPLIDQAAGIITSLHLEAVRKLLLTTGFAAEEIEAIGMNGQTIAHRPSQSMIWQIGSGETLANSCRTAVVSDFARTDVEAGGQGSPLLPVFLRGLFAEEAMPLAILDLGWRSKLTAFYSDKTICALDCGMGTGLLDAWMMQHGAGQCDLGGATSERGKVDEDVIDLLIANPWFREPAPKAVNPGDFGLAAVQHLGLEDGAATLTAFAAESVTRAILQLAERPDRLLLSGGGRHNETLIRTLKARCGIPTQPIDKLGWQGDAIDAQAMAYLAIRRMAYKSSTFPETTGVPAPHCSGIIHIPMERRSTLR